MSVAINCRLLSLLWSRLRSGPKGTGWLDLRYSGMPGSRSLFFPLGTSVGSGDLWRPRQRQLLSIVGLGAAGAGVLAGSRVRLRRADAANNSCLPCRAGCGGRRRSGRTARPPPSGGRGAAIFPPPPLDRPLFSLDVERPFLPLSRSFFSALGELFSLFSIQNGDQS